MLTVSSISLLAKLYLLSLQPTVQDRVELIAHFSVPLQGDLLDVRSQAVDQTVLDRISLLHTSRSYALRKALYSWFTSFGFSELVLGFLEIFAVGISTKERPSPRRDKIKSIWPGVLWSFSGVLTLSGEEGAKEIDATVETVETERGGKAEKIDTKGVSQMSTLVRTHLQALFRSHSDSTHDASISAGVIDSADTCLTAMISTCDNQQAYSYYFAHKFGVPIAYDGEVLGANLPSQDVYTREVEEMKYLLTHELRKISSGLAHLSSHPWFTQVLKVLSWREETREGGVETREEGERAEIPHHIEDLLAQNDEFIAPTIPISASLYENVNCCINSWSYMR